MSIGFGSNIAALRALRQLGNTTFALGRTTERLSSGLRINRASDDAAGLSVASILQSQNRVFGQGVRNINDGISALSLADSALGSLSEIVTRQRELATQAANGSLSLAQRLSLAGESDQLTGEFNRIIGSTRFNGLNLFQANFTSLRIQGGYGDDGGIGLALNQEIDSRRGRGAFGPNPISTIVTGTSTYDQILGDFTGDGKLDYLQVGKSGSHAILQLYRQTSPSSFTSTGFSQTLTNQGTVPVSLASGDFNNDGALDFVAATYDSSFGTLRYTAYYNNGNGTSFSASVITSGATGPPSNFDLKVGDFNGDGNLDIAGTGISLRVLLGNGQGTFTLDHISSNINYAAIDVADVNGDGKDDIVGIVSGASARLDTWIRGGSGFASALQTSLGSINAVDVALGDLNRDGIIDVVYNETGTLVRRLGNGDGTYQAREAQSLSASPTSNRGIFIRDIDSDGILDVSVLAATRIITFLAESKGASLGIFGTELPTGVTSGGFGAWGDIDQDGVDDFVGSSNTSSYLYLQSTNATTNADYVDLRTVAGARSAIDYLDSLLAQIGRERGVIGAAQSRLSSFLSVLSETRLNGEAAVNRILDADTAVEAAEIVRLSILQNATTGVLAQANQAPQIALSLLQSASAQRKPFGGAGVSAA